MIDCYTERAQAVAWKQTAKNARQCEVAELPANDQSSIDARHMFCV